MTLRAQKCGEVATASKRFGVVAREFPFVAVETLPLSRPNSAPEVRVAIAKWRDPTFDLWAFDRAMDRAAETNELTIAIVGAATELPKVCLEVLTRCQRLVWRCNPASDTNLFAAVLERHRRLHDLSLPLVRADFDHSLDAWQWVLRLAPRASLAVQLAALFHDVERLVSEAEQRVEQHAVDYQLFKDRHAAGGAELAAAVLGEVGVPDCVVREVARLITMHERRSDDRDLALLNDADALSFFSLNSAGFADYYGPEHTRRKVAYSLDRLSSAARRYLDHVHLRADIRAMMGEEAS